MSRKLFSGVSERSDWLSICAKVSPNDRTSRRTVRKSLRAFGQAVELCESLSERSDKPSNCAKVSPSVRTSRRTVRKSLRAIGQAVELCEMLSKRSDKPSNCAKRSPSDRTSRRTVRNTLQAFGQAVELCEMLSERSDKPSNCAKVSPSVRTARRNVRRPEILPYNPFDPRPETLFFGGQSFILFNDHLHMIGMLQCRITFPIERSAVRNHTTEVGSRIEITRIRRNAAIGLAQKQFVRTVARRQTDGREAFEEKLACKTVGRLKSPQGDTRVFVIENFIRIFIRQLDTWNTVIFIGTGTQPERQQRQAEQDKRKQFFHVGMFFLQKKGFVAKG